MVTIRPAVADDNPRLAHIVFNKPDFEAIALIGDEVRARKYGYGKIKLERIPSSPTRHTVVAEIDGNVVGLLQYTLGEDPSPKLPIVWLLVKTVGPVGFLRRIPRLRSLRRVNIAAPDGAFNIAAINVDPDYQNQKIGSALLGWANEEAVRVGATTMSLVTWIGYRSLGLYERDGFKEVRSVADPQYQKYFDVPGRVLIVKELSG